MGGNYNNGKLYDKATGGNWWGSTAHSGALRYNPGYNGSSLSTNSSGLRSNGFYIRCVSEEKTVTDLTYLQDMTGEIAVDKIVGDRHQKDIKKIVHRLLAYFMEIKYNLS